MFMARRGGAVVKGVWIGLDDNKGCSWGVSGKEITGLTTT